MSLPCEIREQILAPKALRSIAPEALQQHLEHCETCQATARTLIAIRTQLGEHAPVPRPGVQARILGELQAQGPASSPATHRTRSRLGFAIGLGLAAAMAWVFFLTPKQADLRHTAVLVTGELARSDHPTSPHLHRDDPVPVDQTLRAGTPARIETRLSHLTLSANTVLTLGARKAVVEKVGLLTGRLHAEVTPLRPGQTFEVQTPEATVTVIGTAFVVSREGEKTVVEVEHGVVRAASHDGRRVLELRAGDRAVFPLRRPGALGAPGDDPARAPSAGAALDSDALAEIAHRARSRRRDPSRRTTPAPRGPRPDEDPAEPPKHPRSAPPATPEIFAGNDDHFSSSESDPEQGQMQIRRLARARRALQRTPEAAVALARAVLDEAPAQAIEAEALAVLADGFRRGGRLEEAARTYAQVAAHPAGTALAEESLLQLALLRRQQARKAEARAALAQAARRFPEGVLAPERVALTLELLGREGDALDRAAALLLGASRLHGPELESWRVKIAERLAPLRPADARALLAATRVQSLSPEFDARHEALSRALGFSRVE